MIAVIIIIIMAIELLASEVCLHAILPVCVCVCVDRFSYGKAYGFTHVTTSRGCQRVVAQTSHNKHLERHWSGIRVFGHSRGAGSQTDETESDRRCYYRNPKVNSGTA